MVNIDGIATEQRNAKTMDIDRLPTLDMVKRINDEDKLVAHAVEAVLPAVAAAVDAIYDKLANGGRLVYCGAGTSGRLGALDAAECPPTFGVSDDMVIALMAGGASAFVKAREGAEDDARMGEADLLAIGFCDKDILVGIAASGRTPYVIGAMRYAKQAGAPVVALTCAPGSAMSAIADIDIAPSPGPEALTGSTRLKSGTAQKMVLNMLSTGVMIKLGKTYGNLMVDLKATNEKLMARANHIVTAATGATKAEAEAALRACGFSSKTAILMILAGMDCQQAQTALKRHGGRLYAVLASLDKGDKA